MSNLFDINKIERSRGCDYFTVDLRVDSTEQLFLLLDFIDNQNLENRLQKRKEFKNEV